MSGELGADYRSIIFDVKGTTEDTISATDAILEFMADKWETFGLTWLGGQGWPTDEVFLMPCPETNPPTVEP